MTSSTPTQPEVRARYGASSVVVAIAFGVVYAYVLWGAVGNLVELPSSLNSSIAVPWALLVLDVALPFIVFAAAFWLGRRRTLANRALLSCRSYCARVLDHRIHSLRRIPSLAAPGS
jgi:hypothetical protein